MKRIKKMSRNVIKKPFCRLAVAIVLLLFCASSPAQTFVYAMDNLGFFDNRETQSPYQHSQTLFGTRLGVMAGLTDGSSSLMAGSYAVQEFGRSGLADFGWTMYYRYRGARFSGAFGSFPRRLLQRDLPDLFLDDSLRYYVPNVQGALLQYQGDNGSAELYCNWRNRQSFTEREIFEIVSDGAWYLPVGECVATFGYHAGLTHFSVRKGKTSDKVYDKIMLHPVAGWQARPEGLLIDSLLLAVGPVVSFNRDRTDNIWKTPVGVLCDMRLANSFLSIRNRLYAGDTQYSDYALYGRALHQGDAWYRSRFYDRVDVAFHLFRRGPFECSVMASFHFTEGVVDNSQVILLRAMF